jgi:Ni/Co efflux regulator RcnB
MGCYIPAQPENSMKKFALMIAALATIFIAAPSSNADAQTVVIKRDGHHHGARHRHGARAQIYHPRRGYHRGRGHGNKVIVIKKKRYHRY